MKKVSIFPSSKQRFFSLFAAVFLFALLATPIFAATVTPSDEASDSSEQTVIDNVKKALQEKKDEIKDLGSNQRRQAYLAKITRLTEETLTVQTTEGNKIIPLSDAMAIRNFADQKNLELSKLAVDDWIAVYGNTNNGIFTPDRIVLYEDDYSPKEHKVMLGSISEIYSNSLAITPRGSDEKISFVLDKNTNYQDSQGKDAQLKDFFPDLQCLVIASENSSGNYVVSTLRALVEFDQ